MNTIVHGLNINLQPLHASFFERYGQQFSFDVRKALQVVSVEQELHYLQACLDQQLLGNATFFYCIFNNSTQDLIGAIEIRNASTSRGQLYTWVHENYWGSGLFQEALQMATKAYFAQTKALYFDAHVDVTNMRSYKALKKAGFADLGFSHGPYGKQFVVILRNHAFVNN